MDVGEFYSENPAEVWEQILGEKMHYHHGVGGTNNDPFDQAIIDLLRYIKPLSSVLDCGCGWGGPARLLQQRLGCFVTGVTNAQAQADYITDFDVVVSDLHDFVPKRKYDTALFVESYVHLTNPAKVMANISGLVDSVLIKDFVAPFTVSFSNWHMTIRTKEYIISSLERSGYKVMYYLEVSDFAQPSINYWYENLGKIPRSEIRGQVLELKNLCEFSLSSPKGLSDVNQCIIHAVKDRSLV